MTQLVGVFLDYIRFRFDFDRKFRTWMYACVCFGIIFVLVNGRPLQEISIKRWLNKRNHLSPFLFLHVVEGISSMFSRAFELNLFSIFRVNSLDLVASHLQYADDTHILVGVYMNNL